VISGALGTLEAKKTVVLVDYNWVSTPTGVVPDETTFNTVRELLGPLGYSISEGPPVIALPKVFPRGEKD
jgi:hypothetical protein